MSDLLNNKITSNTLDTNQKSKETIIYFIKAACLIAIFEIFYCRTLILSDTLIGSCIDSRLNNIFVEHWYRVLLGLDCITRERFFAPTANSIFFSDLQLGMAPFYCVLRFFGCGMFTANKITLILLHYLGSLSLYVILNRCYKISSVICLTALSISSWGCAYTVRLTYSATQMMTVSVLPLFFWALVIYLKELTFNPKENTVQEEKSSNKRRYIAGFASSCLLLFMLYTSFYVFFFCVIFCLFVLAVLFVRLLMQRDSFSDNVKNQLGAAKNRFGEIVLFLLLTIVGMMPAGWGYYVAAGHLKRHWFEITSRLLRPLDIINVSPLNWLYGSFINSPYYSNFPCEGELQTGLPPLTLLLAILACAAVFTKKFKKYWMSNSIFCTGNTPRPELSYQLLVSVSLAFVLGMLSIFQWNNYSLWWFIYQLVPGGKGIRITARFAVLLYWPLSIIAAFYINSFLNNNNSLRTKIFIFLIFVVAFAESQITGGLNGYWHSRSQEAFFNQVPPPPANCRYFFVNNSQNRTAPGDIWIKEKDDQVNAMFIANRFNIETINGYSGGNPPKWYLRDLEAPGYFNSCTSWIERNGINKDQIFVYNLINLQWVDYHTAAKGLLKVVDYDNPDITLKGQCTVTEAALDMPGFVNIGKNSSITTPFVTLKPGNYLAYIVGKNIENCHFSILDIPQSQSKTEKANLIKKTIKASLEKEALGQKVIYFTVADKNSNIAVNLENTTNKSCEFYNMSFEEHMKKD